MIRLSSYSSPLPLFLSCSQILTGSKALRGKRDWEKQKEGEDNKIVLFYLASARTYWVCSVTKHQAKPCRGQNRQQQSQFLHSSLLWAGPTHRFLQWGSSRHAQRQSWVPGECRLQQGELGHPQHQAATGQKHSGL